MKWSLLVRSHVSPASSWKKKVTHVALSALAVAFLAGTGARADGPVAANTASPPDAPTAAETHAFLEMLVTDSDAMRPTGLFLRKSYVSAATLYTQGKEADALKAFGDYFVDKLRNPLPYGINPSDLDPYQRGLGGLGRWPSNIFDASTPRASLLAAADNLMQGKMSSGPTEIDLGPPGKVNWYAPYPSAAEVPAGKDPNLVLQSGLAFAPLVEAYLNTRDERYLKQWTAYMWDWYRHCDYVDKLHPCIIPDGVASNVSSNVIPCVRVLSSLAKVQKSDGTPALDPLLTPFLLKKLLLVNYPPGMAYTQSNVHNWTPSFAGVFVGLMFDEFKLAPTLFRQSMRRNVEDNAVTQNLRDGTENQQDPWYNENYFAVSHAIDLIDQRAMYLPYGEQYWVTPYRGNVDWSREIREHLNEHESYLIHLRTPQNEWPIPFRGGDKRAAGRGDPLAAPDAYAEAVDQSIMKVIDDPDSGVVPPYDSEWFPYAGFNIVRSGWKRDSSVGALFTSPVPGAYGGYRSRSNNNVFGLSAYGQDLLVDDCTGHYMYPSSPIKVDGKDQFFHETIYKVPPPCSHKTYQVSAWTDPAPWRWHSSDRFNLMEGIYQGAYGNPPPFVSADQTYGNQQGDQGAPPAKEMIHGVSHQRLVLYDRHAGLWIVVDRMNSADSHTYDQAWLLPITPAGAPVFDPADITADAAKKTIRTDAKNFQPPTQFTKPVPKANLTMKQFYAGDLKYKQTPVPAKPRSDGRVEMYGWERVDSMWEGKGAQQVITAILPREPGKGPEADFQSIEELKGTDGADGFTAVTPDGSKVQFLSAPAGKTEMEIGSVKIKGEALLLSGDHGIALGCEAISIDGKDVAKPADDFEFEVGKGTLASSIPIYRPIAPVKMGPDVNVFTDTVDVTMSSQTPGVEIRYTIDGSDPTPLSELYQGPVTLKTSARVKARAYRPGVTKNPVQNSGTEATAISLAVFNRTGFTEPVTVAKDAAGLQARYFEGDWKNLWFDLGSVPVAASANGVKLWDFSMIPASNPPLGTAPAPRQKYYAVEYSGFLNIPEDGVYTFHAPHELVYPDTEPGYELKLELGMRTYTRAPRPTTYGLQEWYPSTRLHALGNWSVALKKGKQPFRLTFIDFRTDAAKKLNQPGINDYIWAGSTPDLKVSGPNLPEQPIPDSWCTYSPPTTTAAR